MADARWAAVDEYIAQRLVDEDDGLNDALEASVEAGLPPINVTPNQGKLLHLLARMAQARTVLEIGTLGGYSTIWLARAVGPGGRVVTLEVDPAHAEVARTNLARAGVAELVDIRVGRALDTLPLLHDEAIGPFDLFFIDADKASNAEYFAWALRLSRPGSVIVIDNVVRDGRVVDPTSDDGSVVGTRRLFDALQAESSVTATAVQTVGSKGYDGFAVALVTGSAS